MVDQELGKFLGLYIKMFGLEEHSVISDETVAEVCDETSQEKDPLDEPNVIFNDTSVTDVDKAVTKPEFPRRRRGRPKKFRVEEGSLTMKGNVLLKPLNPEESKYGGEEYKIAVETEVKDKLNTESVSDILTETQRRKCGSAQSLRWRTANKERVREYCQDKKERRRLLAQEDPGRPAAETDLLRK